MTTKLIRDNQAIVMEDLNTKGMMKKKMSLLEKSKGKMVSKRC